MNGTSGPWAHCVAGMHMGKMTPRPLAGEFDAVLTVGTLPSSVEDDIKHRHIPLSYMHFDESDLGEAVEWVHAQVQAGRTVLVRSEGGRQRPALVIACVCVQLGASVIEATMCVRRADNTALTDFRYLNLLRQYAGQP